MNKAVGLLGICRRAGKLQCGHDVVKESIVSGKAELVLLAVDASLRLKDEAVRLCSGNERRIPVVITTMNMADFYKAVGKKSAIFSVTDTGFATTLLTKYREELDDNEIQG